MECVLSDVRIELVILINFVFETVKPTITIWKKKQITSQEMNEGSAGTER
jgi:molybdopterin synthase catalytic subunit